MKILTINFIFTPVIIVPYLFMKDVPYVDFKTVIGFSIFTLLSELQELDVTDENKTGHKQQYGYCRLTGSTGLI